MEIVIASVGRRAHYIECFREGLRAQGICGEVLTMEYRTTSPSFSLADRAVPTPAYDSQCYRDALLSWFERERPQLFVCLNDYELQILSQGLADKLRELGRTVLVLVESLQSIVLDKCRMSTALEDNGIPPSATRLGSQIGPMLALAAPGERSVVKHRFGCGSTGLRVATAAGLDQAIMESAKTALGDDGRPAQNSPDSIVVQKRLPGIESVVDAVFSVDGSSRMLSVLARSQGSDARRGHGCRYHGSSRSVRRGHAWNRNLLRPTGAIDVDFRETAEGGPLVIDINLRLGGGCPFCHRAGADLPSALIRSAAGLEHRQSLLDYGFNVTTARREEFTVLSTGTRD